MNRPRFMVRFKKPPVKSCLERPHACQTVIFRNSVTRGWPSCVKTAILHANSLAQFTLAYTRGWAANSPNSRIRLKAELDRALQLIALLREQLRIHKLRMAQLPPDESPSNRSTVGRTRTSSKPQIAVDSLFSL